MEDGSFGVYDILQSHRKTPQNMTDQIPKKLKRGSKPRLTLQEVQSRTEKFGWGYDYLRVNHTVVGKPTVTFICPSHGEKTQGLGNHLGGSGCKACGVESRSAKSRLTLQDFESRASTRGWTYKYISTNYAQPNRVSYICAVHGLIVQALKSHADGHGCPHCAQEQKVAAKRLTLEEVEEKTKQFGRDFKYLKVDYVGSDRPTVTYICQKHGELTQNLFGHLSGRGCRYCRKVSDEVEAAKIANRDAKILEASEGYKALRVDRSRRTNYIVSMCSEHGEFSQPISRRLTERRGCPKCSVISAGQKRRLSFSELVDRARKAHGDRYEYKEHIHEGKAWLQITCNTHGDFVQSAASHFSGHGCLQCKNEATSERNRKTDAGWFETCRQVHDGLYEYMELIRVPNLRSNLRIRCMTHGEFIQDASNHVNGSGCPSCVGRISKQNLDLSAALADISIEHELEASILGSKLKLDVYIPGKKVAVELNGIYWHSEEYRDKNYHAMKQAVAQAQGISVINIFDDEWKTKREIVMRAIKNRLGVSSDAKVSARQCSTALVATADARAFVDANHIQGFAGASAYFGLTDRSGTLVAVAGFAMKERGRSGKKSTTHAELVRYCTSASVRGGLSKLLKHAQATLGFTTLTTFSDVRFFGGSSYAKVGFTEEGRIPPDYFYSKQGLRIHKSNLQKSRVKAAAEKGLALFDPSFTELELSQLNGYSRVWDCGKVRWVKYW